MKNKTMQSAGVLLSALTLAGCSGVGAINPAVLPSADALGVACPALSGMVIPASAIGLPSGQATVTSARSIKAVSASVRGATLIPATPDYCQVMGRIAPVDPAAQLINFQVNMPLHWNLKALQYGGSGFNGTLVTGLDGLRDAPPDELLPLTRGYVTLGTDSGHQSSAFPKDEPGRFAMNDEMLTNFAYASYKKTKDVASVLMQAFYGRLAAKTYYFGSSEGGREALTMAQRFPADYDGIVGGAAVISWTAMLHAHLSHQTPQFTDWFDAAKVPLLSKAVTDSCDALDGLVDGIVSNYLACPAKVNLQALRCSNGLDTGASCLSDVEIQAVQRMHTQYELPLALANGVTSYPRWLYGHEDALDGPTILNMVRRVTGTAAPTVPAKAATAAQQWLLADNWIRFTIARDPSLDVTRYIAANYASRVQATSALMDSVNPDLSAYAARGGKLLMREYGADEIKSPLVGANYYNAVVATIGQAKADQTVRLYVSSASTHTGNSRSTTTLQPVPTMVGMLDTLDQWASEGKAPPDVLLQTHQNTTPPFAVTASRPMCRYPRYPHYVGGDTRAGASYECRVSVP